MKKYNKKSLLLFTCTLIIFILTITTNKVQAVQEERQTFIESTEEFNNPDIGIYRPTYIRCMAEGEWPNTKIQYANGLVHLRLGIKSFSAKGNGVKDYDITQEHIEKLNSYLQQVRDAGGTAIVRFAYDNFEGQADLEPEINQVLKHIEQLEPFFRQNEDIIATVETGFLGNWGEQHTSKIVTQENIKKLTQKLLEVVPESRTVNVRKPLWYCATTNVNIDEIDKDVTLAGTDAYRIGMFNDGYLGSASDLGSFKNRKKEIAWLNNQATHTIYGGEVAWGTNDTDEEGNLYHSIGHIQNEMFQTHTSYLNEEWNNKVVDEWKTTNYTGQDLIYQNKTAYTYIKNHLGYRLVLKEAETPETIEQGTSRTMELKLENVGAGNVVNEKSTYVVLKNGANTYYIPTNLDVRTWNSRETQNLNIDLPINEDMAIGHYEVYLKIINKQDDKTTNQRTIRFANENTWDEQMGANKIGNIEIIEKQEDPQQPDDAEKQETLQQPSETEKQEALQQPNETEKQEESQQPNDIKEQEKSSNKTNIKQGNKEDNSVAKTALPNTGYNNIILYIIFFLIIVTIYVSIKWKVNK